VIDADIVTALTMSDASWTTGMASSL